MPNEFKRKRKHYRKSWTELKAESSWALFKIMAEFVDGYDKMSRIGPCVSVFGSARLKAGTPYYIMATELAQKLSKQGYGIITGGGPGIMEAANRGAQEAEGVSVGLNIDLPHEQSANQYIGRDTLINFNYFFVRKVMFIKYAQAFVMFPGGFGTMDEMFEVLTLIQTHKIKSVPIVLIGSAFWERLMCWLKEVMCEGWTNISAEDLELVKVVDNVDEAIDIINAFYAEKSMKPNF
jgi:hypothetical protein